MIVDDLKVWWGLVRNVNKASFWNVYNIAHILAWWSAKIQFTLVKKKEKMEKTQNPVISKKELPRVKYERKISVYKYG